MSKFHVSIIISSKNEERRCLKSLKNLDYPKNKYEILVADVDSREKTLQIFQEEGAKLFPNLETNKAFRINMDLQKAKRELLTFKNTNYYVRREWLKRFALLLKQSSLEVVVLLKIFSYKI